MNKPKKLLICILLMSMLASMAACSTRQDTTPGNQQGGENTENSKIEVSEVTDYEELKKKPVVDNSTDSKEYSTNLENLNLTGDYTQLTKTAESERPSQWPTAMYDVGDDVLLIYSTGELEGSSLMFRFVDTETGEQIKRMTVDVEGKISSIEDIRESKQYGENRDIKVNTSLGVYYFNLDAIEETPEEFLITYEVREKTGKLVIKDHLDQTFDMSHQMYDIYTPDERLVYTNNEGVFVADIDGSNEKKIVDQPKNKKWYGGSSLAVGTDGKPITKSTMAVYSSPKFMDGGKKILCSLTNYATNNPYLGFVVIDVETGEVFENNYYDKSSATGKLTDWDNFSEIYFLNYSIVNDTEIAVTTRFLKNGSNKTNRLDVMFDISKNEVIKDMENFGGLTRNFEKLVLNEVTNQDDINATQVAFVEMDSQTILKDKSVKFESGSTNTVALSDKYALVLFFNSEKTEEYSVLVKIPQ